MMKANNRPTAILSPCALICERPTERKPGEERMFKVSGRRGYI
jgi:hypothetical protein